MGALLSWPHLNQLPLKGLSLNYIILRVRVLIYDFLEHKHSVHNETLCGRSWFFKTFTQESERDNQIMPWVRQLSAASISFILAQWAPLTLFVSVSWTWQIHLLFPPGITSEHPGFLSTQLMATSSQRSLPPSCERSPLGRPSATLSNLTCFIFS